MEREFPPEVDCIGLVRAPIKANCRALSQAWIGHAQRRIGAGDRHAANSAGLPMLPLQRIGIAIRGNRRTVEQPKRSVQAFDKRLGFSSDMAGPRSTDHVAGPGEPAFQKRDKNRGSGAPNTLKVKNEVSTQKRAPQARRPSTAAPGVGGSRPAREVTLPLVSRSSALRPRSRSGSCAVSAPRGVHA